MRGAVRALFGSGLVAALFVAGLAVAPGAGALAGTVVINELLYKPAAPDPGEAEFIELHNPGDTDVDLTGWTIEDVAGPHGTLSGTLVAGGYGIVTQSVFPDPGTRWPGVTLLGTFDNGLGGGGDTVIIKDSGGSVVDEVAYDDASPWPGEPDVGDGASLELIDPLSDNSLGVSWAGTATVNTPGLINSVTVTPPPGAITNVVATPFSPDTNDDITVTATVPGGGADPVLYWIEDFDPGGETAVTMKDDGVAPDVTSGDGVFTATIPDQSSGSLVRYRIVASTGAEYPTGDARRYDGVVVTDPGELATGLTKMEWFIPEDDYDSMFDDPVQEVTVEGSVLAVDGVVYDNMTVKIRGGNYARVTHDKQGLSFDMPAGVDLNRPDMVPYPIDEFALIAERGWTFGRQFSAWEIFYELASRTCMPSMFGSSEMASSTVCSGSPRSSMGPGVTRTASTAASTRPCLRGLTARVRVSRRSSPTTATTNRSST